MNTYQIEQAQNNDSEAFKVYYADDSDPEKAGQGLAMAPLLHKVLGRADLSYWMMSPAEQVSLIYLLENLKPRVAIEIGTRFGGSLQVLSQYCEKVYSLDIDPEVPNRLAGKYHNVEYIIGSSVQSLPTLLTKLEKDKAEVSFVLVDGDHSSTGVKQDIDNILQYTPVVPLYIVMHDSFNPECRKGLRLAKWLDSPYVHVVELDFVPGTVNPSPKFRGQLWGGLSLAVLLPHKREGKLEVTGGAELAFQLVQNADAKSSFFSRLKRLPRRLMRFESLR